MVFRPSSTSLYCRSAIIFGGITVAAGITGTVAGSELSKYLGKYTRKAEALVCSLGMMLSAPLLMVAITVVHYEQLYVSWVGAASLSARGLLHCSAPPSLLCASFTALCLLQVFVFLSEFFLCLNWAPVSAILLVSGSLAGACAVRLSVLCSAVFHSANKAVNSGGSADPHITSLR